MIEHRRMLFKGKMDTNFGEHALIKKRKRKTRTTICKLTLNDIEVVVCHRDNVPCHFTSIICLLFRLTLGIIFH